MFNSIQNVENSFQISQESNARVKMNSTTRLTGFSIDEILNSPSTFKNTSSDSNFKYVPVSQSPREKQKELEFNFRLNSYASKIQFKKRKCEYKN